MSSQAQNASHAGLNPDILWRVVADEALLLDTISGNYFSLDPIATEIWVRLTNGDVIDEIASGLAEKYAIDRERARSDVADLVVDLKKAGIWRQ
jgi:hypothetical protein